MKKIARIIVVMFLGIFICLPGMAWADFTLIDVFGGGWQNNPPTPGPIDRIDTVIMAGDYVFADPGAINFSQTGWTSQLITDKWTTANSPTPFTGNMYWNYSFADSYTPGSLITLGVNYYNGNGDSFVIAEEWTWGSGGWSGGSSGTPVDPPGNVPLPASALLLGTGLFGMGLLGWRRKSS